MKTSAIVCAAAAFATVATATPCNMGDIQGKLLPNATEGLKKCATETGFDIWAISGFPTQDQATKIMKTRDCVAFMNQINERANQEIQCDFEIGGQKKEFSTFLIAILKGKTGDKNSTSGSGSDEIEVPKTTAPTKLTSSSMDGTTKAPTAGKTTAPTPAPTKSAALSTTGAVLSAGLVAVAGLALQL